MRMNNRVREEVARGLCLRLGGVTDHPKGAIHAEDDPLSNIAGSGIEIEIC